MRRERGRGQCWTQKDLKLRARQGEAGLPPPEPHVGIPEPWVSPSPSWGKGLCSVPFMTPRAAGPESACFSWGGTCIYALWRPL